MERGIAKTGYFTLPKKIFETGRDNTCSTCYKFQQVEYTVKSSRSISVGYYQFLIYPVRIILCTLKDERNQQHK